MPNTRIANAVRLEFAPASPVQANLAGAAFTGDWLWVAGDEACGLDRLRRLAPVGTEALRFGEARDFPLTDLLDLPGTAGEEADLEGMAVADGGTTRPTTGRSGSPRSARSGWTGRKCCFATGASCFGEFVFS